jgi:hypothetical protein
LSRFPGTWYGHYNDSSIKILCSEIVLST